LGKRVKEVEDKKLYRALVVKGRLVYECVKEGEGRSGYECKRRRGEVGVWECKRRRREVRVSVCKGRRGMLRVTGNSEGKGREVEDMGRVG